MKNTMEEKNNLFCNKCCLNKPTFRFKKDERRQFVKRGGFHTTCKDCQNQQARTRHEKLSDDHPLIKEGKRKCRYCKLDKFLTEYSPCSASLLGKSITCRKCTAKKQTLWRRSKGIESVKKIHATIQDRTRYGSFGLKADDFKKMYDAQNGKCDICESDINFYGRGTCVDHDHVTDKIRGILCGKCNTGLGMFNDNKIVLEKAIVYLKKHKEGE